MKSSRIGVQLNLNPEDDRFVDILNETVERLITRGHWVGCTGRFSVTVSSAYTFTCPPQILAVEKIAVSLSPVFLKSSYWEFISSGDGVREDGYGSAEAIRLPGLYPTQVDITPGDYVKVVCDGADDAGETVVIHGTDTSDNIYRTLQSGTIKSGVALSLAAAGTTSSQTWNSITGIVAPTDLNKGWWIYGVNPSTGVSTLLSSFHFWESSPGYVSYKIHNAADSSTDIEFLGRLQYVPVRDDNDFVLIPSIPALKAGMSAVMAGERSDYAAEEILLQKAERELNNQLAAYNGGEIPAIEVVGPMLGGEDPVESLL